MKFRYDINTLRAIAVLGVVLFHYKIPYFSGGFSGVDIFFVISGYLMSRIVITSLNNGTFSLVDFYGKRFKRIVPALLCLVSVITVLSFFVYLPIDYQKNTKNAASSIVFLSNFLYWKNSDYFDASSDSNLFLHTWSLSLEWQFYLIYPVVLWGLHKVFKKKVAFFVFFTLVSLLVCILSFFVTKNYPTASFYLLPTRCWELLAGGVAFLIEDYGIIKIKNTLSKKIVSIIGYLLALSCFVFFSNKMDWPGMYTVIPVIVTALILIVNYNDLKILKWNVIQFLGRTSYSLYLWHWPLYVIAKELGYGDDILSIILLITLSIFLSFLSYKYIESSKRLNNKAIMATGIFLLCITSMLTVHSFNDIIFKKEAIQISNYPKEYSKYRKEQFTSQCFVTSDESGIKDFDETKCLKSDGKRKNILLIGDSHAAQFSQSFRTILNEENIDLSQATASGCLPILRSNGRSSCSDVIHYVYYDYVVRNLKNIRSVMICANWVIGKDDPSQLVKDLEETIKYLNDLGLDVIIIGQNETYSVPYPSIAAKEYQYGTSLRKRYLDNESFEINDYLKKHLGKYYIDIYDFKESQRMSPLQIPYMFDVNHFSPYGAEIITQKIFSNSMVTELLK